MYGKPGRSTRGQLALMDAVVFFVIAMTISCILVYYARAELARPGARPSDDQSDPEAVLQVFLRASLGEDVVLDLNGGARVSAGSEIAECITVEVDALVLGANLSDFRPLNERYVATLEAICSPVMEPYLVATHLSEEGERLMFSIPGDLPSSGTRYASSAELPCKDGSLFLLTLVLVPSTSASLAS